ncbi:MAG: hypothetical protein HY934_07655 [Candidatus Firestonebacteria bacterium]|nr:hypothetical protein [Candidatus Firestonebacteria bacterium]
MINNTVNNNGNIGIEVIGERVNNSVVFGKEYKRYDVINNWIYVYSETGRDLTNVRLLW